MKALINGVLIILLITFVFTVQLFGQEWSKEQKEVWKNVETYWDFSAKGDVEGFLSYVHDDYCGWSDSDALPDNKIILRKYVNHFSKTRKVLLHVIKPVGINIYDNMAIVQYYFSVVEKEGEGKEKFSSGRWTDILLKQGDKWVVISDHGGTTKTE